MCLGSLMQWINIVSIWFEVTGRGETNGVTFAMISHVDLRIYY